MAKNFTKQNGKSYDKDLQTQVDKLEKEAMRKEILASKHLARSRRQGGDKSYEKAAKIQEEAHALWKEIKELSSN